MFKSLLLTALLTSLGGASPATAEFAPSVQLKQAAATDNQELPWQTVTSTPGRYVVDLPGEPVSEGGNLTLFNSELNWHMNSVTLPTVDEDNYFEYYMVAYMDLPARLNYEHSQKEILDAAVEHLKSELNDEDIIDTLDVEEIAFNGLPARFLTADCFGQLCLGTIVITSERLYLALAMDDDRENFAYFFDSLDFIP